MPRSTTLPSKEMLILELLSDGDRYGLELVAASGGALKRGTVYVTLGRMEKKGLIRSRQEDAPETAGGLPRRLYAPTAVGARALQAWQAWSRVARQLKPAVAR